MQIPNRSHEVAALVAARPDVFVPGEQFDAHRLAFLRSTVIPTLNALDAGRWGLMTKTDEGGKIPCDILMWRDTRHIVDVFAGLGAGWHVFPDTPTDAWVWTRVEEPAPEPPTPPPSPVPPAPVPTPGPDLSGILARFVAAEAAIAELEARWVASESALQDTRTRLAAVEARPQYTRAVGRFWGMTIIGTLE